MWIFPTIFNSPWRQKYWSDRKSSGGKAKMGRTSFITVTSFGGIVRHTPAVDEKVWFFRYFFLFLSRFRNAVKQCNFQNNNYGAIP